MGKKALSDQLFNLHQLESDIVQHIQLGNSNIRILMEQNESMKWTYSLGMRFCCRFLDDRIKLYQRQALSRWK